MPIVYLNNAFMPLEEAKISPMDRGFLYGDGIYEGISSYDGKPFFLEYHIQRLNHGLRFLEMLDHFEQTKWSDILQTLIEKNSAHKGAYFIYLHISRGFAEVRNHAYPQEINPTTFITLQPFEHKEISTLKGQSAITAEDIRWHQCNIKSTSLLGNVKAYNASLKAGADQTLLIRDNKVTECASNNFFIVKDGVYYTPPLGHNLLPGITRKILIELMNKHHLPYEEMEISPEYLAQADELFITGTSAEITPITTLNNNPVGNGKVGVHTKKLFELFDALREMA